MNGSRKFAVEDVFAALFCIVRHTLAAYKASVWSCDRLIWSCQVMDNGSSRFSVRQVLESRRRSSNMANVPENGILETKLDVSAPPGELVLTVPSGGQLGPRRSLVHMTREALPRMANYRNLLSVQAAQRPTLGELHEGVKEAKVSAQNTESRIYVDLVRKIKLVVI